MANTDPLTDQISLTRNGMNGVMYLLHLMFFLFNYVKRVLYFPGVGSRSQVSLELSSMASPATDTDRSPVDWSAKSAGTSTVGPR